MEEEHETMDIFVKNFLNEDLHSCDEDAFFKKRTSKTSVNVSAPYKTFCRPLLE